MGFLDNSGDIILDAVLTDVGRKRLSEGNFRISKFAIGDDEIDYQLFDPDHVSGSAYFDLEILQSPVLEAGTKNLSSINYGLYSLNRNDLLYLPILALNSKIQSVSKKSGSIFILPANEITSNLLVNSSSLNDNQILSLQATLGSTINNKILLETGLYTSGQIVGTSENQRVYLLNTDLSDTTFTIKFDNKFVGGILSTNVAGGQELSLINGQSGRSLNSPTLKYVPLVASDDPDLVDYKLSTATGIPNNIYHLSSDTVDTDRSQINGPRATALSLVPAAKTGIDYTNYGKTGQTMFGIGSGTATFKYVDTTVYVQGTNTGVNIQLPIRIVEKE